MQTFLNAALVHRYFQRALVCLQVPKWVEQPPVFEGQELGGGKDLTKEGMEICLSIFFF